MIDFETARRAMVDCQVRPSDVTRFAIIDAMSWAPRERFVPRDQRPVAYADAQIPVAPGRALLDPRTFSKILDAAEIGPGDLVLDVGSAYGYSAVVAARMAAAVVALEEDETMAAAAPRLAAELEVDNVAFETGALCDGAPASGPYDVILVEGGVVLPPEKLIAQLKEGGRLLAVVQDGPLGMATMFTRTAGGWSSRRLFDAPAPVLPGFDATPAFEF
ncbi:MAG: protein-L-isoaspartate O-methyltransferase family protein [Rubrimonas sp.]